jgi:hypothetical protein
VTRTDIRFPARGSDDDSAASSANSSGLPCHS